MRVLITGGRDYQNHEHVSSVLGHFHSRTPITLLIHGAAKGADTLANEWALANDVPRELHPVSREEWRRLERAAGPIRNARMLESRPDVVIAFPGGKGTANMTKLARQASVAVILATESE